MKTWKSKSKISTVALILMLTISAVLVALPITNAQFGPALPPMQIDIPIFLAVTAEPNPVGVNQLVYLHAVFSKPTPTNQGTGGDLHEDVNIEIVDPDGQKTVLGPYTAGMTGAVYSSFTPTQVGEYQIQAIYPGQVLTGQNPDTGARGQNTHMTGSTLLPAESEVVTLVVQEDAVGSNYQSPGLPEEYWTRPIYSTNWAWGEQIGSNWFGLMAPAFMTTGGYDATGNVQPYGEAPNTAHIMW